VAQDCSVTCPHDNEWFDMTDAETRPFVMRHNCKAQGCWNDLHRPRLELLKKCFGGLDTKIKPQDIDGSVERNGYFLFLEFKGDRDLFENKGRGKTALDRYHEAMTSQVRVVHTRPLTLSSPTTTSVYVVGDAKTMAIKQIKVIYDGKHYPWEECDLYGLRRICWEWYEWTAALKEADMNRAREAVRSLHPMIKKYGT